MEPSQDHLPRHASVVVIGGGVMGCSTLYHLAGSGVTDAILLERNKLTSGTTWHSAAQVRALRSTRNLTDLVRYSIDLYSRLEQETGQQVGWINKGSLSIATNDDRMIHVRRQAALAGLFGVRADTVTPAEAAERWPLMNSDDVVGAVWSRAPAATARACSRIPASPASSPRLAVSLASRRIAAPSTAMLSRCAPGCGAARPRRWPALRFRYGRANISIS